MVRGMEWLVSDCLTEKKLLDREKLVDFKKISKKIKFFKNDCIVPSRLVTLLHQDDWNYSTFRVYKLYKAVFPSVI